MQALFWIAVGLIFYHVVLYPAIVLAWARLKTAQEDRTAVPSSSEVQPAGFTLTDLPSVTIIVPAFNEAAFIAEKIANLARLEYPDGRVLVVIALDGCTDATAEIARKAIADAKAGDRISIREHDVNRGKIAVVNEETQRADTALVALTDVSASVPPQALIRLARHFDNADIGLVCPSYGMSGGAKGGETGYWSYQTAIKAAEGAIAAPIGPHGAFYVFRRALWRPLPTNIINDDFVMPMRIVLDGARAIYDTSVVALERERSSERHDFRRRIRLGAGNVQQIIQLAGLAHPRRGALAFLFVSGKGLRAILPLLFVFAALACILGAISGVGYLMIFAAFEILLVAFVLIADRIGSARLPKPVAMIAYAMRGIAASALGAAVYIVGRDKGLWRMSNLAKQGT